MTNRTERIDPEQVSQRAKHLFVEKGLTCSEACLLSAAEALGIESPMLSEIAIAFGGGIGRQGDVCGALSGCIMAISLVASQKASDYAERKKLAMATAGQFYQKFASRCGSVRCADICGVDLADPESAAQMKEKVRDEKCAPAVAEAARLLSDEINQLDDAPIA